RRDWIGRAAVLDCEAGRDGGVARGRHDARADVAEAIDIVRRLDWPVEGEDILVQQIGAPRWMHLQAQQHRRWLRAVVAQGETGPDLHCMTFSAVERRAGALPAAAVNALRGPTFPFRPSPWWKSPAPAPAT